MILGGLGGGYLAGTAEIKTEYERGYQAGLKVLPFGTEKILTSVWNKVLEDKKSNCKDDKDCVIKDGKPTIQFEFKGSIKENFIRIMGDFTNKYNIKIDKK